MGNYEPIRLYGEYIMRKYLSVLLIILLVFTGVLTWAGTPERAQYGIRFRDEGAAHSTPPSGYGELYVNSDVLYFKTDGGSATNLLSAGATAWDDITNPDAAKTLTFSTYATIFTGAKTDGDQWTFKNTSAFGDYSIVKIQQLTGDATNGYLCYMTAADTNVDGLVVSNTTADLTADNTLCSLQFTDDGDANGIYFKCLDNSGGDTKFLIAANGATTIAGSAAGTDALTLTAGDITVTSGALTLTHATNGDLTVGDDATIGGALAVTGAATIGTTLDVTGAFTAASADVGTWYQDAISPATVGGTLTVNGDGAGGVNIGSTSTGAITLGAAVTVADGKNVTVGEGSLTVDDDVNESAIIVTADTTTTGSAIQVTAATTTSNCVSVTADDLGSGGKMIYLDTDNLAADNYYLYLYDGAAADFTVGRYGGTVIAGNASTDVLTVTTGDVQVDDGKINIDTDEDDTSYIKRNQGTTTGPALTVWEAAAAADNAALFIDQDATAAASYGLQIDTEGGTAINLLDLVAAGDGIAISTAASYTGQLLLVNDTLVGTNGEGLIDIKTTANQATGSTLIRLDADTGTLVGATNGFLLSLDDDSGAQATSYAMNIESASNEALRVGTGTVYFVESLQVDGGIALNEDMAMTLDAADEEFNLTSTAVDYAAGAGIVTVYDSAAAGQTNASYLMRLVREADGDAQDNFILCEDNSTGAAGNGDNMFQVDTGGAVTMAGSLTVNGAQIIGDGATEVVGTKNDVVDGAAGSPYSVTIVMSRTVFINSQAIQFNLPEASTAIGTEYTFVVAHASNLDVNPDDADKILAATDVTGDMIRSSTVGDTVTLVAIDATNWAVKSMYPASTDWADAN